MKCLADYQLSYWEYIAKELLFKVMGKIWYIDLMIQILLS